MPPFQNYWVETLASYQRCVPVCLTSVLNTGNFSWHIGRNILFHQETASPLAGLRPCGNPTPTVYKLGCSGSDGDSKVHDGTRHEKDEEREPSFTWMYEHSVNSNSSLALLPIYFTLYRLDETEINIIWPGDGCRLTHETNGCCCWI